MTVLVETKCWNPHKNSKVTQALELCKLVNKLCPHYCLDVIFPNVIFNVVQFLRNKKLQLKLYMEILSYWIVFSK